MILKQFIEKTDNKPAVLRFCDLILENISQIMLQDNRITGILFLVGIFLGSWQCGVGAILASASGSLSAHLFKFDLELLKTGFFGFSSALVGVALVYLFKDTWLVWSLVVVGGALASFVQHLFNLINLPAYTFPFVLVEWGFVFILQHFTDIPPSDFLLTGPPTTPYDNLLFMFRGFGEVIFQPSVWSGALFFVGIFISNPMAALYAFGASFLGAVFSAIFGQPLADVNLGLFGFNVILTGLVFAGDRKSDGVWVLIGCFVTIAINNFLVNYQVFDAFGGVFTFPFVMGTWLTLILKKGIFSNRNFRKLKVVLLRNCR